MKYHNVKRETLSPSEDNEEQRDAMVYHGGIQNRFSDVEWQRQRRPWILTHDHFGCQSRVRYSVLAKPQSKQAQLAIVRVITKEGKGDLRAICWNVPALERRGQYGDSKPIDRLGEVWTFVPEKVLGNDYRAQRSQGSGRDQQVPDNQQRWHQSHLWCPNSSSHLTIKIHSVLWTGGKLHLTEHLSIQTAKGILYPHWNMATRSPRNCQLIVVWTCCDAVW